ncbi:MAG: Tenascin domain [Flavipsychrobacter sp.]|jgi:hypothetical protein|nr:Tenascin domain [Flavipsychrobacter sp.]
MKNPLQIACKIVALVFVLASGSCIKDKCGKVICFNKGVCVDGQCACPSGYEGSYCDTGWFEKFAGVWHTDEAFVRDTGDARFKYNINITGSADSFFITGLHDSLDGVICKRQSLYEFSFRANQLMRTDSSIIIRGGEGRMNNGIVTGLYSFKYKDTVLSVVFKWTK